MLYMSSNHCLLGHLSTGFNKNVLISIITFVINGSQMMFKGDKHFHDKGIVLELLPAHTKELTISASTYCILKLESFY